MKKWRDRENGGMEKCRDIEMEGLKNRWMGNY
jgi:hypothetical protein